MTQSAAPTAVHKSERWLVCGGRNYTDGPTVLRVLTELMEARGRPEALIHGDATGADTLAKTWALLAKVEPRPYSVTKTDWNKFGRAAGSLRNQQMLDEGKPTLVVAFPGGPGTADMSRRALRANVELIEIGPKGERL